MTTEKIKGQHATIMPRSMLSSDFANLAEESKRMIDLGADWLHLDVMVGFTRWPIDLVKQDGHVSIPPMVCSGRKLCP